MVARADDRRVPVQVETEDEQLKKAAAGDADDWNLHRWQVSFRSGTTWHAIGEFVALNPAAAIERAVEIFGPGDEAKAEAIPWDAAPLPRLNPLAARPRS
jgi:hypothetical protein